MLCLETWTLNFNPHRYSMGRGGLGRWIFMQSPQPSIFNPKHDTLNPNAQAVNPYPQTSDPEP